MDFSSAIAAQLAGRVVRVDALVEFQFASQTIRLWNGFGSLPTLDGKVWQGIAGLGQIDGLSQALNGVAPTQTFTVSGVDARFASLAREDRAEYYRQPVVTYLQFFDEDWQPLDNPSSIALRQMDTIQLKRSQVDDGFVYSVSITAETPFTTRRRPAYGYLTDRDQQQRFPGDLGLNQVAGIDGKPITWRVSS